MSALILATKLYIPTHLAKIVLRCQRIGRQKNTDNLDKKYSEKVVLVNANHKEVEYSDPSSAGTSYVFHPMLQNSSESLVKRAMSDSAGNKFSIPVLTTSVFVVERPIT